MTKEEKEWIANHEWEATLRWDHKKHIAEPHFLKLQSKRTLVLKMFDRNNEAIKIRFRRVEK